MRTVIGYTGEGRARKPVYHEQGPAVGRVKGYVAKSSSRGYAVIGGALVESEPPASKAANQRAYKARQKAARA